MLARKRGMLKEEGEGMVQAMQVKGGQYSRRFGSP